MRAGVSSRRSAFLAALLAAGLSACAGAQRPPEAPAPAPVEESAAPSVDDAALVAAAAPLDASGGSADRAVEPAAGTLSEPASATGPARDLTTPSARPKATTEAAGRARQAFLEGVRLESAGELSSAAAAFDRATAQDPQLAWAPFNAGLLRERLGDDPRAVAAYERALEDRPDFAPAGQNLARVWVRQGKLEEAERTLRARIAKADGVALRVALAEVLLAAGRLPEAEAECRTALKADEKNVPAMVVLATTYGRKKRSELAKMVLENARQVDPADPSVWNRLGFVEMALGNRVQAIEHFKTAAALRPDYPEAHANYGAMLADADDFAGAAVELELAVKYGPRSASAWLDLGNAYRGLQQFEKAEQAYRKAQELDGRLPEAQFDLAVLYLDVEKPGLPTLQRLEQGVAFFDAYEQAGGQEPRVAAYRKDAAREIDREKKRLAREEKDRARKEAEARRKAEEEARLTAEAEAKARAEAEATALARAAAAPVTAPTVAAPGATTATAADAAAASTGAAPAPAGEERSDK